MGEKRKHRRSGSRSGDEDIDVVKKVTDLKRRHQHEAVLAGDDDPGTLFWSKKVERDLKSGGGQGQVDVRELAREREAELQRVRMRRWDMAMRCAHCRQLCQYDRAAASYTWLAFMRCQDRFTALHSAVR